MKKTAGVLIGLVVTLALSGCNETADREAPISFDGIAAAGAQAQRDHGLRLTQVLGCRGCHGPGLEGQKWDDDPKGYGVMWASNLTRAIPLMTDRQLEDLLRRGVHPTRSKLWAMPSEMFQHLSAPDMAALIAHLRAVPPAGTLSPSPVLGDKARTEIAKGAYKPSAVLVQENRDELPADAGPQFALGRYITSLTCAECHGMRLEGGTNEEGTIPDLIVASAYSPAEFGHFITTGVTPGNRKIDKLMVKVAQSRFSHLTPHERQALYGYLQARAQLPQ